MQLIFHEIYLFTFNQPTIVVECEELSRLQGDTPIVLTSEDSFMLAFVWRRQVLL